MKTLRCRSGHEACHGMAIDRKGIFLTLGFRFGRFDEIGVTDTIFCHLAVVIISFLDDQFNDGSGHKGCVQQENLIYPYLIQLRTNFLHGIFPQFDKAGGVKRTGNPSLINSRSTCTTSLYGMLFSNSTSLPRTCSGAVPS